LAALRGIARVDKKGGSPYIPPLERESASIFAAIQEVRDAYSVRIAKTGYRAIAVDVRDGFLWIWIGPHDEYERLLSR
jgi:hypothetical protein